jgi:hypothetical protein
VSGLSSHADEPKTTQDDPSVAPTVYVTLVFVVAVVITLIGLTAYHGRVVSEEADAKVVQPGSEALAAVHAEQSARLAEYRWVAPDSGLVAIPIERAMSLLASDLARTAGATSAPPAAEEHE